MALPRGMLGIEDLERGMGTCQRLIDDLVDEADR